MDVGPTPEMGTFLGSHMPGRTAGMKLLVLLVVFVLSIFLIEVIWNQVVIKKFPRADIQRLSFVDALAIAVFVSLLTGGGAMVIAIK